MVLKFVQIPCLNKLWTVIEQCSGNVYLELTEGKYINLKDDLSAFNTLEACTKEGSKIKLYIVDTEDYLKFINHMVGASYQGAKCV